MPRCRPTVGWCWSTGSRSSWGRGGNRRICSSAPDPDEAISVLRDLRASELNARYDRLVSARPIQRKIRRDGPDRVIVTVVDELAYFSATAGTKKQQDEFTTLLRDLVARGRAAGFIMIVATQRPSADVVPTSFRDLFGYRWAVRC